MSKSNPRVPEFLMERRIVWDALVFVMLIGECFSGIREINADTQFSIPPHGCCAGEEYVVFDVKIRGKLGKVNGMYNNFVKRVMECIKIEARARLIVSLDIVA